MEQRWLSLRRSLCFRWSAMLGLLSGMAPGPQGAHAQNALSTRYTQLLHGAWCRTGLFGKLVRIQELNFLSGPVWRLCRIGIASLLWKHSDQTLAVQWAWDQQVCSKLESAVSVAAVLNLDALPLTIRHQRRLGSKAQRMCIEVKGFAHTESQTRNSGIG